MMHVLLAHNRYQIGGGEDGVVDAELRLMEANGTRVTRHEVSNDEIGPGLDAVRVGLNAAHSSRSARVLGELIRSTRPDLMHVHNFFPLLTPSIYDAAREHNIPVVQTLHNYRTICCAGTLLREGKVCTKCVNASPIWGIAHKCYRGSRLASAGVANMIYRNRRWQTWNTKVDRYICLTEFSRKVFAQAGFREDRLVVKPNFVDEPESLLRGQENYALYSGRLSVEKGIAGLLDAWGRVGGQVPLRIAGDGPLADLVSSRSDGKRIIYLGRLSRADVYREMLGAGCLVFPSLWYEGLPLTILEAFSVGTPVVASRIGSLGEIVKHGVNGLLFEPGNSEALSAAVLRVMTSPDLRDSLKRGARQDYVDHYTADENWRRLSGIYASVLKDGAAARGQT